MRLDHVYEGGNDVRVKSLIEPRCTTEVPSMDHQVNQTEPQERGSRDLAPRPGNGLLGRRVSERVLLLPC